MPDKYHEHSMVIAMNAYRFWWDEENIEHIAEHGVDPYEAEIVIRDALRIRKAIQGKYVAYGQTDGGRYLMVVFAHKDKGRLRVVTARDLTSEEKYRLRSK